jgi:hypothetical protein
LTALVACGAPGSDASSATAKAGSSTKDTSLAVRAPAPPPRIATRTYRGYYRRLSEESRFQPCGTTRPLDVYGPPEARLVLHERVRYASVWQGTKMYGVFQGAIVTDTVKPVRPDSGTGTVRTRFFLMRVDSLRTWQVSDCGGMRVS